MTTITIYTNRFSQWSMFTGRHEVKEYDHDNMDDALHDIIERTLSRGDAEYIGTDVAEPRRPIYSRNLLTDAMPGREGLARAASRR